MKVKVAIPSVLFIGVFILQSCFTPQHVIRLKPENDNGTWIYGQQFVSDSIDGVIYEIAFDQVADGRYWFDFTVTNLSNLPVMVDPVNFYMQVFDGRKNPLTENKIRAVDPENEILELEKQISRMDARQLNQAGYGILAATVDVATGIAALTDDNPYNDHERTYLVNDVMAIAAETECQLQSINDIKEAWKSTVIRKTTLPGNYNMKGKVFFPVFRNAIYVNLYLPVDDKYMEIGFMQLQFPVR